MSELKMYFTKTSDSKHNGRYSNNLSSIVTFNDIEDINGYIPIINNDNDFDYDSGLMTHALIEAIRHESKRKLTPSDFKYYFMQIYNMAVRLYKEISKNDFKEIDNLFSSAIRLYDLGVSSLSGNDDLTKEHRMIVNILQCMMSLNYTFTCRSFSDYGKFTLNGTFDTYLHVDDFYQSFYIKDQTGKTTSDFFIPTLDSSLTHELLYKSLSEDLNLSPRDIFYLIIYIKGRLFGETCDSNIGAFHKFFVLKCERDISNMLPVVECVLGDDHHSDYAMKMRGDDERLELLTVRHHNLYRILEKTRDKALTTNWTVLS